MQNSIWIRMVVDRSASMRRVHAATVAGINEFITIQKNTPGDGRIKVFQFDEHEGRFTYETILDTDLKDATLITAEQFNPRGMTPLYDAMGRTISELGTELSALLESERPERVLVCVVTDGEENRSTEFKAAQIKEMVEHQQTKYNWNFTYVGANQDAVLVGDSLGIAAPQCMRFTSDAVHTKAAFASMGKYTARVRSSAIGSMVSYTDVERSASLDEDDSNAVTSHA